MPFSALPRPTERIAIVSLLLVFLCGCVVGALAMSFKVRRLSHGSKAAASGMLPSTGEWKQQLDLSDEQLRQLTSVLDDFARYYDNLLADGNSRIMQILTPQQKVKYDEMVRRHKSGAAK